MRARRTGLSTFQSRQLLEEGRLHWESGGIQLLSRQEPGRMRRGGRGNHQRCGAGAEDPHASRPRPGRKYFHDVEGYNGRLDAIQAGILQVKLKRLPEWNERRREAAARYRELFAEAGVGELAPSRARLGESGLPLVRNPSTGPGGFMRHLAKEKIGTGIHYPVPLHLQKAYEGLGFTGPEISR